MGGTVLVLGASGNFGARAAEAFAAAGWQVRRFRRGTDMAEAARGADVIVNAMNPPMYHDWARQIPAITREVIGAAEASGATVLMVGNVYVYGDQPGPWGPGTPHRPVSRKGAIRAAMEAEYRAASQRGVRVILLRGGDFIDPTSGATIFRIAMLKGAAKGRLTAMGGVGVKRAYAWLPDMARAAVMLAERRAALPAYADVPFAGLTLSVADLRDGLARITGRAPKIGRFSWWALRLAAPFWELAREMGEMRYLFDTPHSLDPGPMAALLPGFRGVTLDEVLRAHLPEAVQGSAISTQTGR